MSYTSLPRERQMTTEVCVWRSLSTVIHDNDDSSRSRLTFSSRCQDDSRSKRTSTYLGDSQLDRFDQEGKSCCHG